MVRAGLVRVRQLLEAPSESRPAGGPTVRVAIDPAARAVGGVGVPTLQEQVLIDVPREAVFDRLAQPERGPEWTPNLVRVERTSTIEAGPGLETRLIANVGGRHSQGSGRCVAWDPPGRLVLEST